MPWGFVAAAAVGAAGSIIGGSEAAGASNKAANNSMSMFNTIQGQEQPYMQAGNGAAGTLANLLGTSGNTGAAGYGSLNAPFTAQDYLANQDPGYQFQLQTGAQATRNADTPGVGSLSGAALKDLINFNQNTAATGYQNAFNRYQTQNTNTYNRLYGLASLGQNAASNTGSQGVSLAGQESTAIQNAGNATANGISGAANSASSLGGLAYLYNNGGIGGASSVPNNFGISDAGGWDA
jgi:hypothetical protein